MRSPTTSNGQHAREAIAPALGLLAIALLLYWEAVFGSSALFFRDVLHYYWPTREAANAALRALELPQWNASVHAGIPLLGDIHAGVLYPFNLLFTALDFPRAYASFVVLHLWVGGLGAFALSRLLTGSAVAGWAGAIVFMLSGHLTGLANAAPLLAGCAWIPWVLAVLLADAPRVLRIAALATLLALQALSGDPQSVLYSALAATTAVLWQGRRRERIGLLLAGAVLSAFVAALQLLPAWTLFQLSTRSAPGPEFAGQWAFHPLRLIELFVAFPFGPYFEQPGFWAWLLTQGPSRFPFSLSAYLGSAAAVFAIAGLRRNRLSGLGLTLLAVGLALACAPHVGLGRLLDVPPLRFFRYPEKYLVLTVLGAGVLVAQGVARLAQGGLNRGQRLAATAVAGTLLSLALAAFAEPLLGPGVAALLSAWEVKTDAGTVLALFRRAALRATGFASLAVALVWLARTSRPRLLALAPVLLAIDLLGAARSIVWLAPIELYRTEPSLALQLERVLTRPSRIFRDEWGLQRVAPRGETLDALVLERAWDVASLRSNLHAVYGYESAGGFGAVELGSSLALARALRSEPAKHLGMLNACAIVTAEGDAPIKGDVRLGAVAERPDLRVSLLSNALCVPRVYGLEQVQGASSDSDVLTLVRRPDFDPRRQGAVVGERDWSPSPVRVERLSLGPQGAVAAEVMVEGPEGFVVHASQHYPGWSATIDGAERPVVRVNGATMGVRVPSGRHLVTFRFAEESLAVALALSGAGLLALIALLGFAATRCRSCRRQPEPS